MSSITASSIRRLRLGIFAGVIALLPLPTLAAPRIEVTPRFPENGMVTLRVKVLSDNNVPIEGLNKQDFQIKTAEINNGAEGATNGFSRITKFRLIDSGQLSKPDPAVIVILLDMSGSMAEKDASGVKKLNGAISAIRVFIKLVNDQKIPAQIALVPFGEDDEKPNCAYNVSQKLIQKKLFKATDPKLNEQVNQLAGSSPCAATNLYQPLAEAVQFLGNAQNYSQPTNDSTVEEPVPPRLAVILLSDGYHTHNSRRSEGPEFDSLTRVFEQNPQVRVNTLGYGESLESLRDRAIDCKVTDEQLSKPGGVDLMENCRLLGGDKDFIRRFIVDQPRLSQMAELTSGISLFPKNANEAVRSLETFFKTLREYEIQYSQPGAEPADKYNVIVEVNSPTRQLQIASEQTTVTIPAFAFSRLPLVPDRMYILLGTLGLLGGTVLSFSRWSSHLKQDADRLL